MPLAALVLASFCSAAFALPRAYGAPIFPLPCLAGEPVRGGVRDGPHSDNRGGVAPTTVTLTP